MKEDTPEESKASLQRSETNGDSAVKPLRRACDCCRKRKVKCDGGDPCGPCKKASIRCAYLQPPKKKGPKGLRSARVLHALRKIDDTVSGSPTSPLSPDQHGAFGDWGWNQQNNVSNGVHYPEQLTHQQQHDVVYGPHTSVPPDQTYFAQMPTSMPTTQATQRPQYQQQDSYNAGWRSETLSAGSDLPPIMSPANSETLPLRLSGEYFIPYMQLFFDHMFPIMPVISRGMYLDSTFYNSAMWTSDVYCFMCAICAATIVQLDDSISQPLPIRPGKRTEAIFAEECLRERGSFDYIESMSTYSIMTSFFMFAYWGNHEKPAKAWHYLQEAITFSENLNMDQEESYLKLEPNEAQWRRRLYWLLFITERAYAVQSRKHTRLTPTVQLPEVLNSEDPLLLNGFVNLANLFSAVDDNFVRAWRGSRKTSLCNEAWFAQTQERLDKAALSTGNISETQHLDISVTKEWLHLLTWQVGLRNGLIWGKGEAGMTLDYPIELAKNVVAITGGANSQALDSHGIGMEQKLSDIANCVADVLSVTAGDPSLQYAQGKKYLAILIRQLSSMRGKESRYLKPLETKAERIFGGWKLGNTQTLPLPMETTASYPLPFMPADVWMGGTPRLSMTGDASAIDIMRSLSMSGSMRGSISGTFQMGLPLPNSNPMQYWDQRRPSGKVYDEDETQELDAWYSIDQNGAMAQAV